LGLLVSKAAEKFAQCFDPLSQVLLPRAGHLPPRVSLFPGLLGVLTDLFGFLAGPLGLLFCLLSAGPLPGEGLPQGRRVFFGRVFLACIFLGRCSFRGGAFALAF